MPLCTQLSSAWNSTTQDGTYLFRRREERSGILQWWRRRYLQDASRMQAIVFFRICFNQLDTLQQNNTPLKTTVSKSMQCGFCKIVSKVIFPIKKTAHVVLHNHNIVTCDEIGNCRPLCVLSDCSSIGLQIDPAFPGAPQFAYELIMKHPCTHALKCTCAQSTITEK